MALKKIGALWLKKGTKGTFMSGQVEIDGTKTDVLVFKNNKGNNPTITHGKAWIGNPPAGGFELRH